MLNTRWVAPGTGNSAGYLADKVMRSRRWLDVPPADRVKFVRLAEDEQARRKVTRLAEVDATEELESFDIERISAAIWDWDNEGGA